jgi:hypothetical protein
VLHDVQYRKVVTQLAPPTCMGVLTANVLDLTPGAGAGAGWVSGVAPAPLTPAALFTPQHLEFHPLSDLLALLPALPRLDPACLRRVAQSDPRHSVHVMFYLALPSFAVSSGVPGVTDGARYGLAACAAADSVPPALWGMYVRYEPGRVHRHPPDPTLYPHLGDSVMLSSALSAPVTSDQLRPGDLNYDR